MEKIILTQTIKELKYCMVQTILILNVDSRNHRAAALLPPPLPPPGPYACERWEIFTSTLSQLGKKSPIFTSPTANYCWITCDYSNATVTWQNNIKRCTCVIKMSLRMINTKRSLRLNGNNKFRENITFWFRKEIVNSVYGVPLLEEKKIVSSQPLHRWNANSRKG